MHLTLLPPVLLSLDWLGLNFEGFSAGTLRARVPYNLLVLHFICCCYLRQVQPQKSDFGLYIHDVQEVFTEYRRHDNAVACNLPDSHTCSDRNVFPQPLR